MSSIGGAKREAVDRSEFAKKVGLFEAKVIAINPDIEEYKNLLNIELAETSKATEYLGTSQDGNQFLRIDVWLEEVKIQQRFRVTFFLENKERENKDYTKKQYINSIGSCAWSDDPNNLPDWFTKRDYRVAFVGEEDFYNFLRTWLGELDYRSAETTLQLEWKKLMKGNVKDVKDQIDGEWCNNIVALATISVKNKDGESKEYQGVYNKGFLPKYTLKQFRAINYKDSKVIAGLKSKKPKDLKPHERFVLNLTGEYGSKEYYILNDMVNYNTDDNLVASDKAITSDGDDY